MLTVLYHCLDSIVPLLIEQILSSHLTHPIFTFTSMAENLNIIVFPWLAFGHILPFLELSKHLAKRGHGITFVSTPKNLNRLPKLPPHLSIQLAPLPLPQVPGLPADAEATSDVPPDQVQYLKKAFDALDVPFSALVSESKPDWIIHDFAQHWMGKVAADAGVPCVFFSVFNAAALAFFGPPEVLRKTESRSEVAPEELTVSPVWVPFPSKVAYRRHEARAIVGGGGYKPNASGVSDAYRMQVAIESCKAVAPRSCKEFELDWLSLLQNLYQKPVFPVGLLPPPPQADSRNNSQIMDWLDQQAPKSVVYVALGSEATLSNESVHELALGLELSNLPFLWALRKGNEALPEGFEDRTRARGIIAGWVPQTQVLAHAAVGGFLTHCGMSSVVEAFQFGIPLVMLPIFADQGLNARVFEEKGVGVEVQRDEEDGSFVKEAVATAVRVVMVEKEGEGFREKAKEMIEVFADKECHERYVDEFVRYLIENKNGGA